MATKRIEQKIEKNEDMKSVPQTATEDNSSKTVNLAKEIKNNIEQNDEITSHIVPIKSFRQFVDLFYQKREGILHTHLYNSVKLISFKEGEIVINKEKISDPNFPRIIARYISKWTGRIWTITSSNSNIGKTLQEEDIITQQKEIEIMKKDPKVQEMLNKFPGISIHSITPIGETIDEKKDILTKQKQSKRE